MTKPITAYRDDAFETTFVVKCPVRLSRGRARMEKTWYALFR